MEIGLYFRLLVQVWCQVPEFVFCAPEPGSSAKLFAPPQSYHHVVITGSTRQRGGTARLSRKLSVHVWRQYDFGHFGPFWTSKITLSPSPQQSNIDEIRTLLVEIKTKQANTRHMVDAFKGQVGPTPPQSYFLILIPPQSYLSVEAPPFPRCGAFCASVAARTA